MIMANKWTTEQEQAISLRNRNLLVSAAAGSGKTAVLVERIVRLLLDKENPVNVENLLVVTFTEAAAAEMKERVRGAIDKYLEEEPDNEHLRAQSVLIYHGNISTIHGFCLEVIRDYFHEIDVEPGFRIGEQGELKLIRQDVLEDLLEEKYADPNNQDFLDFVEKFGGGRSDKGIEGKILKLYDYSMSTPNPENWLDNSIKEYKTQPENMEGVGFFPLLLQHVNQYLEDGIHYLKEGLQISMEGDGPGMYIPMLESDLEFLEKLQDLQTFQDRKEKINQYPSMRLSSKRDESVSQDKREIVKEIRSKVKDKIIKKLQNDYFVESEAEYLSELAGCGKSAGVLVDLVKEFAACFAKTKADLNILDFNDMEHLALKILTIEKEGKLEPSAIAKEYQSKFHEIMIDEYQDSNLIQESILTTVSRCDKGENNIFMVGDIKQSIYRFRLSVPELFMEKYDTYTDEDSYNQRVILHKNFRSRPQVLAGVNEVFRGIMRKEVGGITYDNKVALYPGASYEEIDSQSIPSNFTHDTELLICGELEEGEASLIKARIKELLETGLVIDEETKELRKVKYKDIVILLRSIKGHGEGLATYLTDNGIPVHFGSQEGYFDAYEVSVLLDYLRVINNARCDIPLTAVLTSPFVGLTTMELAKIKMAYPDLPFHQGVYEYGKTQESTKEDANEKRYERLNSTCCQHSTDFKPTEEAKAYERLESIRCQHSKVSKQTKSNENRHKPMTSTDNDLVTKLQKFWQEIHSYRKMLPYLGIHDLLWRVTEETGYSLAIQGMVSGNQRKANLDMLIEKAATFEETSYKGVFHFIRYIEELKKYEVEFGEASIADEQSDVVRIMSIHKSKGLEFPVVILAGMGKLFNTQDLKSDLLVHPFLGIGLNAVDLQKRTVAPTILKNVIRNQLMVEGLGEELRVLYVAMTRAKEKLIMTGKLKEKDFLTLEEKLVYLNESSFSVPDEKIDGTNKKSFYAMDETSTDTKETNFLELEKDIKKSNKVTSDGSKIRFFDIISANSFIDWVLFMVFKENSSVPIRLKLYSSDDIEKGDKIEIVKERLTEEILRNWSKEQVFDEKLREQFSTQLNYHYPYQMVEGMKLKYTVSELKKRGTLKDDWSEPMIKEAEIIPLLPKFLDQTEKQTGITRGNAYHLLMENLDFKKEYTNSDIELLKRQLAEEGKADEASLALVDNQSIMMFLETDLANRMKRAKLNNEMYEEQPFVMTIASNEIYSMEKGLDKERVLIQGIIDLWFEEEGEIVLVDYKTDKVTDAKELVSRYGTQLELYGRALEQLTLKKVKERLIYSFWLQEEITVS
jgi:ATP-dependent helicase/nuclease subunit A